jgi:hypothetical protein
MTTIFDESLRKGTNKTDVEDPLPLSRALLATCLYKGEPQMPYQVGHAPRECLMQGNCALLVTADICV